MGMQAEGCGNRRNCDNPVIAKTENCAAIAGIAHDRKARLIADQVMAD
jgi:hypothetical protein